MIREVCSLQHAKDLKDIGIEQQSLFYWDVIDENAYDVKFVPFHCPGLEHYSAFLASELLKLIPHNIDTKKDEPFNNFRFKMEMHYVSLDGSTFNRVYTINYYCDTVQFDSPRLFPLSLMRHSIFDENLANCLAKLIIYLYENGFMNVKKD